MENINDAPARFEDNELYLKDPTSPSSRPYSSKQKAANAAHKRRETLYHADHGRRVFDNDDVEAAKQDGWRDTPFVHPRHPDKKFHVEPEKVDNEMALLLEEAEKLNVNVDRRWSKKRLQDEILKAASG